MNSELGKPLAFFIEMLAFYVPNEYIKCYMYFIKISPYTI
jgi:hypothetical protein